jgi:cell division protein ZapA
MIQLDVSIMGQTYKLACQEGEEDTLRATVAYLDEKMTAIRDAGKIKGTDRIAVMAALGVTAELLSTKSLQCTLFSMVRWRHRKIFFNQLFYLECDWSRL